MKKALGLLLFSILIIFAFTSCDIIENYFKNEEHICIYLDKREVSPAGCTSDGIFISSCICGRENTEIIPASGHSFGEWETIFLADCTTVGRQERSCLNCDLVENNDIPKTSHNYNIEGVQLGDTLYNRYVCTECGESFAVESDIKVPEQEDGTRLIPECQSDFSFVIISAADEEYVKNYLRIYNSKNQAEVEYSLTALGSGRWQVMSEGYEKGESYIAERDGGIFFEEFGNRSIIFTITDTERKEISFSDGIIYLASLEAQSPGYYPYSIEFSDGSGAFFLSLEKADGLSVGDIICVGSAMSAEEILSGVYDNVFGRIKSITKLSDGRTLIMLSSDNLDEIFEELDIYSNSFAATHPLQPNASFEAKLLATLLGDYDFIELVSAFYETSKEFLEIRGLDAGYLSLDEMISAIAVDSVRNSEIKDGRLLLNLEISLTISQPAIYLTDKIGEISAVLSYTVEIADGDVKLDLDKNNLSLNVGGRIISSVRFAADSNILYRADYALLRIDEEERYHLPGCDALTNGEEATILRLLRANEPKVCDKCMPLDFIASLYVTDGDSYHRVGCGEVLINESTVLTDGKPDGEPIPCSDCIKDGEKSGFALALENELVERLTDDREDLSTTESMTVAVFTSSISGVDRELFEILMELDFTPSTESEYEFRSESDFGYYLRVVDGKIIRFAEANAAEDTGAPKFSLNIDLSLCGFKVKYE